MDYIRNGIIELAKVIGDEETRTLAGRAGRLIGLQYLAETRTLLGTADGGLASAAEYMQKMLDGMGDRVEVNYEEGRYGIELVHYDLRIVRAIEKEERDLILYCWNQLWIGALSSFRQIKKATHTVDHDKVIWRISDLS